MFVESFSHSKGARETLTANALLVFQALAGEQVERSWIGGSFVTTKPIPNDIDLVFEVPSNHSKEHWKDRELRQLASNDPTTRATFRRRIGVHALPTTAGFVNKGRWIPMVDGLQRSQPDARGRRHRRGIILLDLLDLP